MITNEEAEKYCRLQKVIAQIRKLEDERYNLKKELKLI